VAHATDLLATKLAAPPPRGQLVSRPRLFEQLRQGLRGRLTLLVAPAGFGKTTLLTGWLASEEGRAVPTAWVSLDAADGDPARFWAHVLAAVDRLRPGVGEPALALLTAPQRPSIEVVLGVLVNALAGLEGEAVLVPNGATLQIRRRLGRRTAGQPTAHPPPVGQGFGDDQWPVEPRQRSERTLPRGREPGVAG
jgi:ATP/maltotriose-dependent transcriptional regulator MalT